MRVLFIGTGEIGLPVLRWLRENDAHELIAVVTQPDKPVGRDQHLEAPPVKAAIAGAIVPVLQPRRINHQAAVAEIRALQPELIVVMAYGQILPRAVLQIPSVACLNLHASLLPKYRGAAPIQAAIAAGDAETGITAMYMDEGLDTGDILWQSRIAIAPDETGGSLHDRLAQIAPAALAEALERLQSGTAPRVAQNSAEATYAPKLEREHGLIDWSEPAEVIERTIRAYDPWPGAFTLLRDDAGRERKLKIFRATIVTADAVTPGKVARSGDGLMIGATAGALLLSDVQLEGKKRMSASDLLRGHSWIESAAIAPAR